MSEHGTETQGAPIAEAQQRVRQFLEDSVPDAHRVSVTKIGQVDSAPAAWEAEADVWLPNPTIASLQLETRRPVIDHQRYLVRLDALLNVLAYELQGSSQGDG